TPRLGSFPTRRSSDLGGELLVAGVDLLLALLDLTGEPLLLGLGRAETLTDDPILLTGLLQLALRLLEIRLCLRDQQFRLRERDVRVGELLIDVAELDPQVLQLPVDLLALGDLVLLGAVRGGRGE